MSRMAMAMPAPLPASHDRKRASRLEGVQHDVSGQPTDTMAETGITPRTIYRAVLLAFALVIAALVFNQLITIIMAALIVIVIALPISAVADRLGRFRVPRAIGAVIGLLIGLGALAGLIALIVPAFTHEID